MDVALMPWLYMTWRQCLNLPGLALPSGNTPAQRIISMGFQEHGSSPGALEAAACQAAAPTCFQEPLTLLTGLEVHPSRPPASNSGVKQVEMNAVDEFHRHQPGFLRTVF